MKIDFVVHNAIEVPVAAVVEHEGAMVQASLPCLEVELTTVKESHGSLTLRFTGADMQEAKDKFKVGETVTWSV